ISANAKLVGFVEVKPLNAAGSHHKIDLGIYRLGIFSKNAIDTHNLKCTIAAQAVGANVSFFL
ncbi:hypothetical protein BCV71DRAFT_163693, partial [Rhizopus microsporus]